MHLVSKTVRHAVIVGMRAIVAQVHRCLTTISRLP